MSMRSDIADIFHRKGYKHVPSTVRHRYRVGRGPVRLELRVLHLLGRKSRYRCDLGLDGVHVNYRNHSIRDKVPTMRCEVKNN